MCYNLVTCEYNQTSAGAELAKSDAKAKHRLAVRTARLYAKDNSFNPILCVDLPQYAAVSQEKNEHKAAGVVTEKAKYGRRSDEEWENIVHPTAKHLADRIQNTSKEVQSLSGVTPPIASIAALGEQTMSWARHY